MAMERLILIQYDRIQQPEWIFITTSVDDIQPEGGIYENSTTSTCIITTNTTKTLSGQSG